MYEIEGNVLRWLYSNNLSIDIPCNVERKDRLCIQCTMSMIEDDYNVPLVCAKYRHLKLFTPSSEMYHAYVI